MAEKSVPTKAMNKLDFQSTLKNVFVSLKELQSSAESEAVENESSRALREENALLKEKNLCLEMKMTEMQAKMDRMKTYCQTILASGHGFKQVQECLAKDVPKFMEDENAAMADKITKLEVSPGLGLCNLRTQLDVYHANKEKQRFQEKMQQQQQKLDRLLESNKQLTDRLATLEKQLGIVKGTCKRIEPAVRILAKRCAAQQRNQLHYRCLEEQANSRVADERRRNASLQTRLGMAVGRLLTQRSEIDNYRAISRDQQDTISFYTKHVLELGAKIEELQSKLTAAQELISEQSDLLSRRLCDYSEGPGDCQK